MTKESSFEAKINRSSLGTRSARAARRSISTASAAKVVARAQAVRSNSKKVQ
jgi:hypothetical protein